MKLETRIVSTLVFGIAVAFVMTVVSAWVTSRREAAARPDPATIATPVF